MFGYKSIVLCFSANPAVKERKVYSLFKNVIVGEDLEVVLAPTYVCYATAKSPTTKNDDEKNSCIE